MVRKSKFVKCLAGVHILSIALFMFSGFVIKKDILSTVKVGDTVAKTESWCEYNLKDWMFADPVYKLRTRYTVDVAYYESNLNNWENVRMALQYCNNASSTNEITYSVSTKVGHEVNAFVKGKATHFETSVGYKFDYAKTVTYSTKLTAWPYKKYSVYSYDLNDKTTTMRCEEKMEQWNWDFSWSDYKKKSPVITHPKIKEYARGINIVETDI